MSVTISKIKSALRESGPATGSGIAALLGVDPSAVVPVLRNAVERAAVIERNGFYSVMRMSCNGRQSYAWVEGNELPEWVTRLARGPKSCASLTVLAEISNAKQERGWPQFALVNIDVRLSHFICCSTNEIIDLHVVRYLPLDTAPGVTA